MLKTTVWYFLALLKHWSRLFAPSLCQSKWLHEVEREELSFVFSQINQFSSVKLSWALLSELSDFKMGQSGSRGVKVQGKVWIWQNHLLEWSKLVKAKGTLYFGRDESFIGIPRGFPLSILVDTFDFMPWRLLLDMRASRRSSKKTLSIVVKIMMMMSWMKD